MKLTRTMKIWLGIGTIWPICYMVLFFIFIFAIMGSFMAAANNPDPRSGLFPIPILVIIPFHLLTILLVIGLTVFYIVYAIKDARLDQTMKIVWIVLFFFAGMLVMPVFYFLYIWKEPAVTPAAPATS